MKIASLACLVLGSSLSLLACGGDVEGGASSSSGSGGETSTSAGSGGSSGSTGSVSTAGTGGAPSADCLAMEPLVLSSPTVSPGWKPGTTATATVTLTNNGAEDIQYPGIVVTADHPDVTPESAKNTFFVLFAGTSNSMDVMFQAAASIPSGTKVGFQVSAMDIQANVCPNVDGLSFEAVIE
jgi:hypothetical protein